MGQNIITTAFETYRNECEINGHPVELDEIWLANIPNLDPDAPVDRAQVFCDMNWVVHRQAPDQIGALRHNAIAYALVMDTRVGDFAFNAMFLVNKASGTIGMVVYKGLEDKIASTESQTGNSLVKTLVMQYSGAADATHLQVDASTWTVDFQRRLAGLMADDAAANRDIYGEVAFLQDGFKVTLHDGQWYCQPGVAYVAGVRALNPTTLPVTHTGDKLFIDVSQQGTATGEWVTGFELLQGDTVPPSYVDEHGFTHHCALIACWEQAQWTDAREKGGMERHLLSADPHTQYLQKTQLSDRTDLSSSEHVASSAAVADLQRQVDYSVALGQGSVMDMGEWNAASRGYPPKPQVIDSDGNARLVSGFWVVTTAGSVQGIDFGVGDKLNYTATGDYFFKTDNTESVTSVNGCKGAVSLTLNDLTGTAENAAKLEGRTKAQVIEEARVSIAQSVINALFPVGHLLITTNAANPSSYGYPGSWSKIDNDASLIAVSSNAGAYSGSNWPVVPVPQHSHSASSGSVTLNKSFTSAAAGSHAHSASSGGVTLNGRFNTSTTGNHSHSGTANSAGAHTHAVNNGHNASSASGTSFQGAATYVNTRASGSAGAHTHSLSINTNGNHAHYTDVNFGAHSHAVSVSAAGDHAHSVAVNFGGHSHSVSVANAGTADATLDVRGYRYQVYMWERVA